MIIGGNLQLLTTQRLYSLFRKAWNISRKRKYDFFPLVLVTLYCRNWSRLIQIYIIARIIVSRNVAISSFRVSAVFVFPASRVSSNFSTPSQFSHSSLFFRQWSSAMVILAGARLARSRYCARRDSFGVSCSTTRDYFTFETTSAMVDAYAVLVDIATSRLAPILCTLPLLALAASAENPLQAITRSLRVFSNGKPQRRNLAESDLARLIMRVKQFHWRLMHRWIEKICYIKYKVIADAIRCY